MNDKYLIIFLSGMLAAGPVLAVDAGSEVWALRTGEAPHIDGILDEGIWEQAIPATDFAVLFPENRDHARLGNKVWFCYDDAALYLAAELEAAGPDSIMRQLGERDNENVVSDWFGIWISPYNDKANDLVFRVTAAGVQLDHKAGPNYQDSSWDPVWDSAVRIHEQGWTVEMALPFSEIRFPAQEKQIWGINMARWLQSTREVFTWTYIQKDAPNWSEYEGVLLGIEEIDTPVRLSFSPYTAGTVSHFPFDEEGKSNWSSSIRGGMDLKYGINESFTLDLTLIPDFGEVQSDNIVRNLTPFEVKYDERRPFFTEGTDLLSKAGRFYSRRVGARPPRFWDVYDLSNVDTVLANPEESQMINASKITGQTARGLGLAIFNATTSEMFAKYLDTSGTHQSYMTSPLTNFNRIVVNQNFGSGSELAVSNSNVTRGSNPQDDEFENDFRDANVSGAHARLAFQESKYVLEMSGAWSRISQGDSTLKGHEWGLELGEFDGAVRSRVEMDLVSDQYDANDLGFLNNNNEISQEASIEFIQHEPAWILNDSRLEIELRNEMLYKPRKFVGTNINMNWNATTRTFFSTGGGISLRPSYEYDYYEARTADRVFLRPARAHIHIWYSSNFNHPLSANLWLGVNSVDRRGERWSGGGFTPRWRINDRLALELEGELHKNSNEHGFADFDENDNPVFGRRNRREITNTLNIKYTLNKDLSTSLRARHYWSQVVYKEFFDLNPDGSLMTRSYDVEQDEVYHVWNIDAVAVWRFAPGSELKFIWKNSISDWSEGIHEHTFLGSTHADYAYDLAHIFDNDQTNSISVKLLYYVDYWKLRNLLR